MVSGAKFYIHGGGRWREVDLNDGRVEGWGKGRFVYAKRGKVQVAKSGAVLTALRDLTAGQPSAVKDGLHLPFKKVDNIRVKKPKKDNGIACDSSRCCKHSHNNNRCIQYNKEKSTLSKVSNGVQYITKADAGIQTSQTLTFPDDFNKPKATRKRQRESTSDDNLPTKITTTATLHTKSPINLAKRKRSVRESSLENRPFKKKVPSLRLQRADSAQYDLYKRRRSKSSDSIVWVVLPKTKENENNQGLKQTVLEIQSKKYSSTKVRNNKTSKSPQKLQLQDNVIKSNQEKQKSKSKNLREDDVILISRSNKSQTNDVTKQRHEQCKELIIDEKDVDLLRNYLMTHDRSFDLLRFDEDDEYKKHFFFKINPLVNVERCPRIARMLRSDSRDEISLKDFVSVLGLKSVKDVASVPKRYKMRKLGNRSYLDRNDSTKSKQTDKENAEPIKKLAQRTDKQLKNNTSTEDNSEYSETEEEPEERQIQRRKSERLDKSLRESNREESQAKIYKTRQSVGSKMETKRPTNNIDDMKEHIKNNVSKKLTEIFSSEKHRKIKLDQETSDSNTDSEENSSDEVSKKNISKNQSSFKKINLDLTRSSTDDEVEYVNTKQKLKDKKKAKLIEILDTNEENSEAETKTVSKDQVKVKNKTNRKNKDLTDDEGLEEERNASKEIKKRHAKRTSNANKAKKVFKESDKENSESDDSKSSKVRSHKINIIYMNKNINVNTDSEEEILGTAESKSSKNNKQVPKNYRRDKNIIKSHTNSDRDDLKSKNAGKELKEDGNKNKTKDVIGKGQKNTRQGGKARNNVNKTTDTLDISSASEGEVFTKKESAKKPVTKEKRKLAPHSISKRAMTTNPYSNLEDHAIVTWVSVGGRAACVNGNRIWRELQDHFLNITGQKRTWHSLRNRYLRYILPSLGAMALPAAQISRLRAAAATGEIKSRKRPSRRNSIFAPAAHGALSRRPPPSTSSEEPPPKRHKHDGTKDIQTSPKRILRSSLPPSTQTQSSPRYSDITRHFATTHRHTSSTPTVSPTRQKPKTDRSSPTKSTSGLLSHESSASKKPKLSLRRSIRNRDSSVVAEKDRAMSPEQGRSRAKSSEKDRSSAKSQEKNRSRAKSPEKDRSRSTSPENNRSRAKALDMSWSSAKSQEKSRSSAKSPEKNRSSAKSQEKSRSSAKSQEKNRSRAKSPEKDRSRAKSPEKDRSSAKSQEKSRSSANSPEKDRSKTRRLFNPGSVLR